jgi:ATP-dependent exoDNAse (exonuclease V) alpha subunit
LGRTGRFDLIEDVQVICAVNDGTDLSRSSLNELLQNELNPRGVSVAGSFYRVGDKVLCRSNSVWPSVRPRRSSSTTAEDWEIVQVYGEDGYEDEQLFVANGDMGRVLAVSSSSVVVRFFAPDRVVRVRTIGEDTDDRLLELGYAATSHKMQGSESRVVIVMIDDSPRAAMVASREWVYTAISRTKEMCALIGDIDVMRRWCDTASLPGRQTLVRPMLRMALA